MKKKLILSLSILLAILSEADAQNPFVVAMYRVKSISKAKIDIYIDKANVTTLEKNSIVWHTVHSTGELSLEAKCPGIPSGRLRFDPKANDTLYLRIEAMGISYITVSKTTKEKMFSDLLKREEKFIEIKTEEGLGNSYTDKNTSSTFTKFGTGFLLSHQGYIITNYHVVNNAKEIVIKGVNGNKQVAMPAHIVARDEANDLVILKLKDKIDIDSVPYIIQSEMCMLGEKIYVLGYPLKTTMGEDVKLVDGLISSRTGYGSNVNSYQISAPIQAGNSGGPLFGDKGNLVGIVNAKHLGAENANYAIKARYIFMLAESIDTGVFINTKNKLSKMSFVEQVDALQKFVYMIEVK